MKIIKIAITGANGFLGKHLVKQLNLNKYLEMTLFNRKKVNLLNYKTLKSFVSNKDVIIHLAGVNRDTDANLLKINTLGTQSILEAIKYYSPLSRLICISTFQVYEPNNIYGLSKFFAERLIEHYCKKENFKSTILRVSNIYGPGCRPFYNSVIATFVDQIKNKQPLSVSGDGEQKRDYIYVGDVVNAIEKSINFSQEKSIEYFNIASGNLISLNKIINLLKKFSTKKVLVEYKKNKNSNNELSFTKDTSDSHNRLNWKALVDLEEGLKLTFQNKKI